MAIGNWRTAISIERWSLRSKIYAGYGLSLTIAIVGITTGVFIARNMEHEAHLIELEAIEDVDEISRLKGNLLELILHEQAVMAHLESHQSEIATIPIDLRALIREDLSHFEEKHQSFKRSWREFEQSDEFTTSGAMSVGVTETEAQLTARIVDEHAAAVDDYIRDFDRLFAQLDSSQLSAEQLTLLQVSLQQLRDSDFITGLNGLIGYLSGLADATEEEREQATQLLTEAHRQHLILMLTCVALSGIAGIIVMGYISRAIFRPLRKMTRETRRSVQDRDFNIDLPVISHDEVGILAQALNSYATFAQKLLQQYREKNKELEATLKELNQTQLQMIRFAKMSSLGQLVAGIAHEINNPTTFIYSNLSCIQDYTNDLLGLVTLYQQQHPNPTVEVQQRLKDIDFDFMQTDLPKALLSVELGSERICKIVQSLQNFSHLDKAETRLVNIHDGIDDTITILGHRLKASPSHPKIAVVRRYGPLPEIECYPGLLNQVFSNIIANAADALAESTTALNYDEYAERRCQITIETYGIDDQWIGVAIADNGPGIPEAVLEQIFDPFFTTKPIGKGTGMGLSISYQIVTQRHGGTIECFSDPEHGSRFVIKLPVRLPDDVSKPSRQMLYDLEELSSV